MKSGIRFLYQVGRTGIPHFDRLVVGSGDDLGAIVIEGNGVDAVAMRIRLLHD